MEKKRINLVVILVFLLLCCSTYAAESEITVYMFNGCGACKNLETYLGKRGVTFKEVDILKPGNETAKREMQNLSGILGVPVMRVRYLTKTATDDFKNFLRKIKTPYIVIEHNSKTTKSLYRSPLPIHIWWYKDKAEILIGGFGPETEPIIDKLIRLIRKDLPQTGDPNSAVPLNQHPDSFRSEIENLKAVFEDAQTYMRQRRINSNTAVQVLKKCLEANLAKIVYEFCQSENFVKVVSKNPNVIPENRTAVIRAAQRISFEKYRIVQEEFRRTCSEKSEITSRARFILRKVIAQNSSDFSSDKLFEFVLPPQPQEQEKEPTIQDAETAKRILKNLLDSTGAETTKESTQEKEVAKK